MIDFLFCLTLCLLPQFQLLDGQARPVLPTGSGLLPVRLHLPHLVVPPRPHEVLENETSPQRPGPAPGRHAGRPQCPGGGEAPLGRMSGFCRLYILRYLI